MQILFWMCAGIVVYVYAGYPALLALGFVQGRGRRGPAADNATQFPTLSIIVAAHNEESVIESKLHNIFAADYPRELVEVLIGSDGSSDRTEQIVGKYLRDGVTLLSFPMQQGKSAMQNGLVTAASGDLLVFTDADCISEPSALRAIATRFADPHVGLVTGVPSYANLSENDVTANEGAYLRYESWLRQRESDAGILAMASGSLFAMRRSLWRPLNKNLGDDFELPLRVALSGYRNELEPAARVVTMLTQNSARSMFGLKVRIVSKDFRALLTYGSILNPFRHGAVAIALLSHKLLRWLVPYFLLMMLLASALLWYSTFYRSVFLAGLVVCCAAVSGLLIDRRRIIFPWSILFSFCLINLASFVGILKSLQGRTSGVWSPIRS